MGFQFIKFELKINFTKFYSNAYPSNLGDMMPILNSRLAVNLDFNSKQETQNYLGGT